MSLLKCECGKMTGNLGGVCTKCLTGKWVKAPKPPTATKTKPKPEPAAPPAPPAPPPEPPKKCARCLQTLCVCVNDNGRRCPLCQGPMTRKEGELGEFWGCCKPGCEGTISARGTYMRAAQMEEKEFNGRPLLEVTRERAGRYVSKCGRYVLSIVKRKGLPDYWEALDKYSGEVVLKRPSCVQLRFDLAPPKEEGEQLQPTVSDTERPDESELM